MRRLLALAATLFVVLDLLSAPARAQQAMPTQEEMEDVFKSLHFIEGNFDLQGGMAGVTLTPEFRALGIVDSQAFLTRLWGNPPEAVEGVLGVIVPTSPHPLSPDGWGVILSYDSAGYVDDSDAAGIDYDALMRDMQSSSEATNKERVAKGYDPVHVLGWAREPHYDAATKKLFWAKRLRFGDSPDETLNYEIRVLGRRGYLVLNVVAAMPQFEMVDAKAAELLSMVHFNQGNTYAEFDSSVDETAAYGVAGLIAGGILTKAGFFKGLIALVIAFKKVIAIGAVGAIAVGYGAVKRFLGRSKGDGTGA
ncbi:MAG: DUF2167 domain-containing protein [Zavarzinia sp.]|nr:DUF2167 domain-containing protein [Zavarzinia sp.]